jgi:hypothetical protein
MRSFRHAIAPLLAATLLAGTATATKPGQPKVYSPNQLGDLEAIVPVLRRHVAYVRVAAGDDGPLGAEERDGFGVVLDSNRIALLAFIVTDAKSIEVKGPSGKTLRARTVLYDAERRVAVIESKSALASIGLSPAVHAARGAIEEGADIYALTTTEPEATVVHGVMLYVGDDPEYGGHYRIDLKLSAGMPVFDARARFVGYSRTVAWDKDRLMLVTPEMITAARTATAAAAKADEAASQTPEKAWWTR